MTPFPMPALNAVSAIDNALLFVSVSMILLALVAVVAWDGLALDARDEAILGPLPIPRATIVARQAGRDGRARRRRPARAERPVERAARQRGRGAAAGQRPGRAAPDVGARDRLRRRGRLRLLHRPGAARGVPRRPGPVVAGGVDAPAGAADRRAGHHVPAHARLDGTRRRAHRRRRRPTGAPPRARRCGSSACTRCSPAASSSTSRPKPLPTRVQAVEDRSAALFDRAQPGAAPLARTALAALVASFAVAVAAFLWNARRPAARARTPQRGGAPRRSLWRPAGHRHRGPDAGRAGRLLLRAADARPQRAASRGAGRGLGVRPGGGDHRLRPGDARAGRRRGGARAAVDADDVPRLPARRLRTGDAAARAPAGRPGASSSPGRATPAATSTA